ncbi:DUF2968 domain-containing protein [Paraburkholderia humisilvae]|uniref:DUF2968 domain-containing protein n=1 Tax=Paraburkholderia humisilvae TaxID=627669 RepID=A0A6J5F7Q6_9BURK|nr:DUF2968 domain-containing protein [Paraburkholderia humisilvae]CAB3773652.1 hypothetical protein LMG29542_07369 [Paraburkholderia humisilvae]
MNMLNWRSGATSTVHATSLPNEVEEAVPLIVALPAQPDTEVTPAEPIASAPPSRVTMVATQNNAGRRVRKADVAELERLSAADALVEFRTFRSFSYSAALLFDGVTPDYYVALCHDGVIWRAFTTSDLESAEAAFRQMEEHIAKLTEGEISRAQRKAEHQRVTRMIAQSEALAERLRNDIDRDAAHAQLVSTRQHDIRKELAQLEAQRGVAQAQMNRALRHVHNLTVTNNESIPHLQTRREDNFRK